MGKRQLIWVMLVMCGLGSNAQTGINPFEIPGRTTFLHSTEDAKKDSLVQNPSKAPNPFEKPSASEDSHPEKKMTTPSFKAPSLSTHVEGAKLSSSFWFWLLLFLTLLVAIIINLNRAVITNITKGWTNPNFCNLLHRDKRPLDRLQYVFLEIIFYFGLAILITLSLPHFTEYQASLVNFLNILGLVILIYLIRHLTLYLLGVIYGIDKETGQYNFTISLFNMINGLVLLLLNYFIAFSPAKVSSMVIIIAFIFIVIQLIYRSIRGLLLGSSYLIDSRLHFLLYLCTCEIMPFLVGGVYLNQIG